MSRHNEKECNIFIEKVFMKKNEIQKDFANLSDEDKKVVLDFFRNYFNVYLLKECSVFLRNI
jgi:hypothetical protein